jgi:hypothetical protein
VPDSVYAIRPHFRTVALHFARLLGMTFGFTLLLGTGFILFSSHPERALEFLGWGALSIAVGSLVLGLVLAVLAIPWQCTLTREGISGRSYIGFRRSIPYKNIGAPFIDSSQGFPLLRMSDRVTGKELVMYPIGLDLVEVHKKLLEWAGPDHPLTQAFRPG